MIYPLRILGRVVYDSRSPILFARCPGQSGLRQNKSSFGTMTQGEFFNRIRSSAPEILAREFLYSDSAHVFTDHAAYSAFKDRVSALVSPAEFVAVVGSGNWKFSLNPRKGFREFGDHSDVDVAVVSSAKFSELWEEMRRNEKQNYYLLSLDDRESLRRNAVKVYSGFISPNWIPRRRAALIFDYKRMLNSLSDLSVRSLKVKMMFFKNFDETIDYYTRGFRIARKAIS